MNISDFFQQYNLHDSLLEDIKLDKQNKILTLTIDFCYWQQKDYKYSQPETGLVSIVFFGVSQFTYEPYSINSDEITDVKMNSDGSVTIITLHDITNESHSIIVSAKDVEMKNIIMG